MSTDLTHIDERAHWWLQARAYFQQLTDAPMPEEPDEIAWRLADFASISATLALAPDSVYAAALQIQEARAQAERNIREFFAATFGDDQPDERDARLIAMGLFDEASKTPRHFTQDADADHIPPSAVQG